MPTLMPCGTLMTVGVKFKMLVTPAATSESAASWAAAPGVAITPIDLIEVPDSHAADDRSDLGVVDVDDATDRETAVAETVVAGEGLAQVAGPDDDDGPIMSETKLATNLVHEKFDVVPDSTRAVAAEVAQVLADLGSIDAGEFGKFLR